MERDWVVLNIDQNHMWVSLAIKEPDHEETVNFTTDFIMDFLKENGVKAGINKTAIEALVSSMPYEEEVVVASGKPAVDGRNGVYQYLVPLEDQKAKPVVAQDGSVDYLNSLKLAMVEEGQTFAIYEPPTKGEYGYTVFSEMVKPAPGRHAPVLRGKGFNVSEDGREYKAKLSGRIYTDNGRIIIEPLYEVRQNLDIEHGNIAFNGDVQIGGDVRSGLSIVAEGSIFVNGHVGNCQLRAGGNIIIGKGVQGKYGCKISARGDVAASFVERCNITAEGNVYADSLMDCRVFARNSVFVTSKKGCIIGGHVSALQGITAKEIGNELGIVTRVQFGETNLHREELNRYKARLKKVKEDIHLLERQMDKYDRIEGSEMSREMELMRMQVIRAKVLRQAEQRRLEDTIPQVEEELRSAEKDSFVRVTGAIYPGAVIVTETASYAQEEAYKDVYYKQHAGQIKPLSPEEFLSQNTAPPASAKRPKGRQ